MEKHDDIRVWAEIVDSESCKLGHMFTYKFEMVKIGIFHKDMASTLLHFAKIADRCVALEADKARLEGDVADLKNKLACSTCLFRPSKDNPCPYTSECCYATGVGHAEGKNFWEADTPLEVLHGAE
jgi:hypothetical protein